LLALLRCEPLQKAPRAIRADRDLSDPWDGLRRLAQIERVRLTREARPTAIAEVGGHLKTGVGERDVVWPLESELWTDELPMPAIVSRCMPAAPDPKGTAGGGMPAVPVAGAATAPEVALVSSAAGQLPAGHPATPLLLVQSAVLNISRGDPVSAIVP